MKNILFFILVLVSARVGAQKINFTDPTNEWLVRTETVTPGSPQRYGVHYHRFYINGDTNINSNTYYELRSYNGDWKTDRHEAYVRYDSAANSMYLAAQPTDILLYNFNLSVGDTVFCPWSSTYANMNYTVISIDPILLNNVYHKKFSLQVTDSSIVDLFGTYATIIEGVGCTTGPLDLLSGDRDIAVHNEISRYVTCFKNQGIYPIPSYSGCSDSLIKVLLDVEVSVPGQNMLVVYPQPATTYANIQLPQTIKSGTLHLYNQVGQTLHTEAIRNKAQVQVNAPTTPGLYYYRVLDNTTRQAWQGKILFE